jgi:hypothetical protein
MPSTTLGSWQREPPRGVTVNLTGGAAGTGAGFAAGGTCKCVLVGFAASGGAWRPRDEFDRDGCDGSSAERRRGAGTGLLEAIEARVDVGDDGRCLGRRLRLSETVEVLTKEPVVDLAG